MYETGMKWLYDILLSDSALVALLAENVETPTRLSKDGVEVKRAAIYDSVEQDNMKLPAMVITPNFSQRNTGAHFAYQNVTLTFDVFDDSSSSLTAVKIAETVTRILEFRREEVDGNIYRTFTNQDWLTVPDEDRPQILHLTFTAQLRYIRQDYSFLGGY